MSTPRTSIAVRAMIPACLYNGAEGIRSRAVLVTMFERELKDTGVSVEHRSDTGIVFRLEWAGVKASGAFDAVNAVAAMAVAIETAAERIAKRGRRGDAVIAELNRTIGRVEVKARPAHRAR